MNSKFAVVFVFPLFLLLGFGPAHAISSTFTSQADFLLEVGSVTTYDFETGSGFPADTNGTDIGGFAPIGIVDGINFNATTVNSSQATSGSQVMTGNPNQFSPATVTFNPGTIGFSFTALDLTTIGQEFIKVTVDFLTDPDEEYFVSLDAGDPAFTPRFFGLAVESDSILSMTLLGGESEDLSKSRAWFIDDLSVAPATSMPPVPVPAAVWLFGTAMIGLIGIVRRRRAA